MIGLPNYLSWEGFSGIYLLAHFHKGLQIHPIWIFGVVLISIQQNYGIGKCVNWVTVLKQVGCGCLMSVILEGNFVNKSYYLLCLPSQEEIWDDVPEEMLNTRVDRRGILSGAWFKEGLDVFL